MVRIIVTLSILLTTSVQANCLESSINNFKKDIEKNRYSKIVFFATWCHSCLPKLHELKGDEVLVVAFDKAENANLAIKKLDVKNKCYYGEEIIEHYKLKSLPYELVLKK